MDVLHFWKNYSLSIVLLVLFLASLSFHAYFEWLEFNDEQKIHGQDVTLDQFYPRFLAAIFENWQSEFLQLFMMVVLTAFLIHRGSAESRDSTDKMQQSLDRVEKLLDKKK